MRVLFDHQIFVQQRHGGISRYFAELATGLAGAPAMRPTVVAPWHRNAHLRAVPSSLLRGGYSASALVETRLFDRLVRAPRLAALYREVGTVDVVHETYYGAAPVGRGRARVVTVFDMIHEREPAASAAPGQAAVSREKRAAVTRADHIICISAATRDDLCRLFDIDPSRTSVVHLGATVPPRVGAGASAGTASGARPILLYVGKRDGYKNFDAMLWGIAGAPRLREAVEVVAFGGGPFTMEERRRIGAIGLAARVRQVGGDDDALAVWYRRAFALVYPSRLEGFGLPPLEAMGHDCPVLCSAAGAIPEVVGEAGVYFDPADPASIAAAIERVLDSDETRAMLVRAGRARVAEFTWARCVERTREIYRRFA